MTRKGFKKAKANLGDAVAQAIANVDHRKNCLMWANRFEAEANRMKREGPNYTKGIDAIILKVMIDASLSMAETLREEANEQKTNGS